jgi:hypothetical protein
MRDALINAAKGKKTKAGSKLTQCNIHADEITNFPRARLKMPSKNKSILRHDLKFSCDPKFSWPLTRALFYARKTKVKADVRE